MKEPKFDIPKLWHEILDNIDTKYFEIPYADQSPSQVLDIYYPNEKKDTPYPVIVHFHGGAFARGTKRDDNLEPMLSGLECGYVVVSAEYRKSGEARFPALLYDAKAVIRFLRANSEKYQLDAEKIAAWGPSAGGWIVSMLGTTNGNPAFEDLTMGNAESSSDVQAVIDWCGPCGGFLAMDEALRKRGYAGFANHNASDSPESKILGATITEVPQLVHLASPYVHVNEKVPPFLILHGEKDQIVPVEQSVTLYDAIAMKVGRERVKFCTVEGKPHHGDLWYHEQWVRDMCLNFLNQIFECR